MMAPVNSGINIQRIEASRYMSVAGLVILIWDHILTFSDEVQLIWKARLSISKVLFLCNRYAVPFAMIVHTQEYIGTARYLSLGVSTCKVWYAAMVAIGMVSIVCCNFLIMLRLWVLWDRSPRWMFGTLSFFAVTQLVALGLAGYVIHEMLPTLVFHPLLRVCVPDVKPNFVMLWSPDIAFQLMVLSTMVWSALDRPRSQNTRMAKVMYRDGSVNVFCLFVLRLANMVLTIVAPISIMFLGIFFLWSISNSTLARLILNLRRLSSDRGGEALYEEETEDDNEEGVEHTELPVLRRELSDRSDPEQQHKVML